MTTLGPLGNKQVRVEDWVTLTPAGDTGTPAVNTVQVTASAVDGSYFIFSNPQPLPQEPEKAVLRWHVWFDVSGSTQDPLPTESNQPGIRVVAASGTIVNDVAAAAASSIEAFFLGEPSITVSATAVTDTVTITSLSSGPSRVQDGVGSRNGVAASTSWTFASATPGIAPATVSFTVASTIEASGSLGASIQQLIPQITDGLIASSYSVANDAEIFDVTMPADATGWPASAAAAAHWQLFLPGSTSASTDFYVWYSVAGLATDPAASGTGIEVAGVASADLAASVAVKTASAINTDGSFTATASAAVVTVQAATLGTAIDAVDVDASVAIVVNQQGGGNFTVDRSNRFANPDFDSSGT